MSIRLRHLLAAGADGRKATGLPPPVHVFSWPDKPDAGRIRTPSHEAQVGRFTTANIGPDIDLQQRKEMLLLALFG